MIAKIFFQFMRKDLIGFRRVYMGRFLDTCLLFFTNVIIFAYFTPELGLNSSYGTFILIGAIASFGLFDIIAQVAEVIFDIEGDQTIRFSLSMPIPSWLVFLQLVAKWALSTFFLCIPLFLVGKLLVWRQFDLSNIQVLRLILMYPTVCLFFGIFSLWLTGVIQKPHSLSSLFLRFINPLFMFGGYFFTWQASFELSPIIGYIILANPMIYVMEGMRSAALGPEGYLPFWNSFFALWGFSVLLGWIGITKLKKRLDCV